MELPGLLHGGRGGWCTERRELLEDWSLVLVWVPLYVNRESRIYLEGEGDTARD
jgi:hypothetical protein